MVRVFWQASDNKTFSKDYPTAESVDSDMGVLYISDIDGENLAVYAPGQWTSAEYIDAN